MSDFGNAAGAAAASRLFRADGGRSSETLVLALQIATASRPQESASTYMEALEAHVQAQDDLIAALREEVAAQEEWLKIKDTLIDAFREEVAAKDAVREADSNEAKSVIRRLGIHFREIADTARNIQAALRENDPRDAAAPAIDALQAIVSAGNLFADSIAESAYTAIIHQLTSSDPADSRTDSLTEGEEIDR